MLSSVAMESDVNDSSFTNELTTSPTNNPFSSRDLGLVRVEVAVQVAIFAATVVGNLLILVAVARRAYTRRKPAKNRHHVRGNVVSVPQQHPVSSSFRLSRMDFMIIHLAIADLSVAFFNVLPQLIWDAIGHFYGTDVLCRMVAFLQVVAMYGSSYVLTATAIDRYLSICHPLRSFTWSRRRMVQCLIGSAWSLSALLASPQLAIWGYRRVGEVYECWAVFDPPWTQTFYLTWSTIAIYVVPLIALTVAYARICIAVWRSSRAAAANAGMTNVRQNSAAERPKGEPELQRVISQTATTSDTCDETTEMASTSRISYAGSHALTSTGNRAPASGNVGTGRQHAVSRAKVKTVKLTVAVVLSYLVCWAPYFVSQMWSVWDINAPREGAMWTIVALMASLNSCINPLIYFALVGTGCRCSFHRRSKQSATASGCCGLRKPIGENRANVRLNESLVAEREQVDE